MHWIYRPGEIRDIAETHKFLPKDLVCDPGMKEQLLDLWRQWLTEGLIRLTVIEDHARPETPVIVGFGISTFVTDAFSAEAESTLPPYLSVELTRRWNRGDNVMLTPANVMQANASTGLNLYILYIGWDETRSEEELRLVKSKLLEAFFFAHQGYQLSNVLQEVFSTEEMERGVAFGALLKNDYEEYYRTQPEKKPSEDQRPYLIGARRGQTREGSYMAPLFYYTPPRFFFRPGEQDLLLRALLDQTDEELAQSLSLSPSAIHKKWRSIYTRVSDVDASFFPLGQADSGASRRGVEKRRHLLSYLRHHPEELRPIAPPNHSAPPRPRNSMISVRSSANKDGELNLQ